jgi:hypothetical protein
MIQELLTGESAKRRMGSVICSWSPLHAALRMFTDVTQYFVFQAVSSGAF